MRVRVRKCITYTFYITECFCDMSRFMNEPQTQLCHWSCVFCHSDAGRVGESLDLLPSPMIARAQVPHQQRNRFSPYSGHQKESQNK